MKELRIIIAGSRTFNDYDTLKNSVNDIVIRYMIEEPYNIIRIISGGAKGADKLGDRYAEELNLHFNLFEANWEGLGKRAGYVRNENMARFAIANGNKGVLIAFWDGMSKGTKNMIEIAEKHGIETHVIKF